jgi:hypothetical protein
MSPTNCVSLTGREAVGASVTHHKKQGCSRIFRVKWLFTDHGRVKEMRRVLTAGENDLASACKRKGAALCIR